MRFMQRIKMNGHVPFQLYEVLIQKGRNEVFSLLPTWLPRYVLKCHWMHDPYQFTIDFDFLAIIKRMWPDSVIGPITGSAHTHLRRARGSKPVMDWHELCTYSVIFQNMFPYVPNQGNKYLDIPRW